MNNSLCLFSSYFNAPDVPYYVEYYLLQLRKHFTRVVFLTNEKSMNMTFFEQHGIECMIVKNEGYDFGMWGKAMQALPVSNYDYLALINDSCILFKPLDDDMQRMAQGTADVYGMVLSDRFATHLQSYFLVMNKKALMLAKTYFDHTGLITEYREVIQRYEIGLSQHFLQSGLKLEGLYNKGFSAFPKNPSFARIEALIDEGMPMIKKKIVFRNYRGLEYYWVVRMDFNADYRSYVRRIRSRYAQQDIIDFDRVMQSAPHQHHFDIFLFAIARFLARIARSIPPVRWLFYRTIDALKRRRRA